MKAGISFNIASSHLHYRRRKARPDRPLAIAVLHVGVVCRKHRLSLRPIDCDTAQVWIRALCIQSNFLAAFVPDANIGYGNYSEPVNRFVVCRRSPTSVSRIGET